jgi:stage III sporulation protein SpoIIIAA
MRTQPHGSPAPSKQPADKNLGHSASIRKSAERGAKVGRTGRPVGILPARIARVEKWLELLCALEDCAKIERRSGALVAYNIQTRHGLENQLFKGEITMEHFHRCSMAIDRVEHEVAVKLIRHASNVCDCAIPECKQLASQADKAA